MKRCSNWIPPLLFTFGALATTSALVGCADDVKNEPDDAGFVDAQPIADATPAPDAETPRPDAAAPEDAAMPDAFAPDAIVVMDAEPIDTGVIIDSGVVDTGVIVDSGVVDTGVVIDSGVVDSGPVDSGITTGALEIVTTGIASTSFIWVDVAGPNTYSSRVNFAPQTLTNLEPGSYTVTASDLSTGGVTFHPTVIGSPAIVVAGQTTQVTVAYSAPLPLVTAINPPVGRAGRNVGITGVHFTGSPSPTVTFDGVPATVSFWTDNYVSVVAPPHGIGTVEVAVTAISGTSTVATNAHFGYYELVDHTLPTRPAVAAGITSGPDGNLWITERIGNQIARVTPAGLITEFPLATAGSDPTSITAGSDGNLWFSEYGQDAIGRITPAGVITEYPLPTTGGSRRPYHIALGRDGNVWFTESGLNAIGRMTPAGVLTEFAVPTSGAGLHQIAAGPDGNMWFTEYNTGMIGKITMAGVVTEYPGAPIGSPSAISAGGDGNVWFTINSGGDGLGRITPTGTVTTYRTNIWFPSIAAGGMTLGRDGNVYFVSADSVTSALVRVAPDGTQTGFLISDQSNSSPTHVVTGPDGNLWFCDNTANAVRTIVY